VNTKNDVTTIRTALRAAATFGSAGTLVMNR
jgi:hypothetical protein